MLPPFIVRAPVTVSRLIPCVALPDDETVAKVAPPLRVVLLRLSAGPPVALTVLVVPAIESVPPVLATMPAPALVVMARELNAVVALPLVPTFTPVPLEPIEASPNEKVAAPTAFVILMPAAALAMFVSVPAL